MNPAQHLLVFAVRVYRWGLSPAKFERDVNVADHGNGWVKHAAEQPKLPDIRTKLRGCVNLIRPFYDCL